MLGLVAGLAAGTASAADPTVVDITPGFSFAEYGAAAAVGHGEIDVASTLFYIDEQAADGWKSWYVFFDPASVQRVGATLHFDQPIHAVLTSKADLDATNALYGVDVDGDALWDDYATHRFVGLERRNAISWSPGGHDLVIDWTALDPGDHIRVLVAVPEPSNYALFAAGLLGLVITLRRRRG
jgi:PEP-CTERM motif